MGYTGFPRKREVVEGNLVSIRNLGVGVRGYDGGGGIAPGSELRY